MKWHMGIDYDALEDAFENVSRTERVRKSQDPVNGHHDLLKRTEHARNRQRRAARRDKATRQNGE